MNLSFWLAVVIWAFLIGFWLGISFPNSTLKKQNRYGRAIKDGGDFYISDTEYRNFLSYDGTTQEKEQNHEQ